MRDPYPYSAPPFLRNNVCMSFFSRQLICGLSQPAAACPQVGSTLRVSSTHGSRVVCLPTGPGSRASTDRAGKAVPPPLHGSATEQPKAQPPPALYGTKEATCIEEASTGSSLPPSSGDLPSSGLASSGELTEQGSGPPELGDTFGDRRDQDGLDEGDINLEFGADSPSAEDDRVKFSCFQASAMNTLNMFGTGPFITIPFVIASTDPAGPQALVGYALTAFACIMDATIWAELASIWPRSGGSYLYLLHLYGSETWGRLVAFLYIWQFLISSPMEIASGFVAMGQYFAYISRNTSYLHHALIAAVFCSISVLILYRGVKEAGRVTNMLWIVTAVAVALTIAIGTTDFQASNLALPPHAFGKTTGSFMMSLGTACRFGLYDFTGYYDACQMAGEVVDPRKSIPRATVITCIIVAVIYFLVYLSVMGYLPWDGPDGFVNLVQGDSNEACFIMSLFTEKACGVWCGRAFTLVVMLTIFGANFAMMCGCAYLPYAAALEGHFFSQLQHRHPTRPDVADYSLLLIGGISFCFCFVPLEALVEAMMTLMLIVQFLGNSVGLLLFHYVRKERQRRRIPWRVPLFPLPCILQIVCFGFILTTTPSYFARGERPTLELAILFLCIGIASYFAWSRQRRIWPFAKQPQIAQHCQSFDSICEPAGSARH